MNLKIVSIFIWLCILTFSKVIVRTDITISIAGNLKTTTKTTFSCEQQIISTLIQNFRINKLLPNTPKNPSGLTETGKKAPKNAKTYIDVSTLTQIQRNNIQQTTLKYFCSKITNQKVQKTVTKADPTLPISSELITNTYSLKYDEQIGNVDIFTLWNQLSRSIYLQLNLARTQPKKYAEYVKKQLDSFDKNNYYYAGSYKFKSNQGKGAWEQAIVFLKNQKPITALKRVQCLDDAANWFVKDTIKNKNKGHTDSEGKSPFDRMKKYCKLSDGGENIAYGFRSARNCVLQWIVDDGVKNRGHRTNIFNSDYKVVGVSSSNGMENFKTIGVIDFLI